MKCALTQDLIIEPRFKALFLTVLILVALAAAPSLMAAPSTAAVAIAAQTDPAKLAREADCPGKYCDIIGKCH